MMLAWRSAAQAGLSQSDAARRAGMACLRSPIIKLDDGTQANLLPAFATLNRAHPAHTRKQNAYGVDENAKQTITNGYKIILDYATIIDIYI